MKDEKDQVEIFHFIVSSLIMFPKLFIHSTPESIISGISFWCIPINLGHNNCYEFSFWIKTEMCILVATKDT